MKRQAIKLIVRNARNARRMLFDPDVWQPALIAELLDRIISLCQQTEEPSDPSPTDPINVGPHTRWP
jgi:hypothetical protein